MRLRLLYCIFYILILCRFLIIYDRLTEYILIFFRIDIREIEEIVMLKRITHYLIIMSLILSNNSYYRHLFFNFVGTLLLINQDFHFFIFIFEIRVSIFLMYAISSFFIYFIVLMKVFYLFFIQAKFDYNINFIILILFDDKFFKTHL